MVYPGTAMYVIKRENNLSWASCFDFTCVMFLSFDRAVKKGCINANHPDKYGHYREAKYTQTKHHGFWKVRPSSLSF